MSFLRKTVCCLFFVGIWQWIVSANALPSYLLPSPHEVLTSLIEHRVLLWSQFLPTMLETLLGLVGAVLLGVTLGVLVDLLAWLRWVISPLLLVAQALPTMAIAPLLVLWLGYGLSAKFALVCVALFFPITLSLTEGLRQSDPDILELAQVIGAKPMRLFWHIRLPGALPKLCAGIRITSAWAPTAAIVGEWVGSDAGLGFLMVNANSKMDMPLMFAALTTLMVWSLVLYSLVNRVLGKILAVHGGGHPRDD